MPSPLVDTFTTQLITRTDPAERGEFRRAFVTHVKENYKPFEALTFLQEAEKASGEVGLAADFFGDPKPSAFTADELRTLRAQAPKKSTAWKRGVLKVLQTMGEYQEHVLEPNAAVAVATALKLIPGTGDWEKKVAETQRAIQAERGSAARSSSVSDFTQAAIETYRKNKLPRGAKGTAEFFFDPMILWGWGIPKTIGEVVPLIKPLMKPLSVLDQAPNQVADVLLKLPSAGIKKLPFISKLAEPSVRTQATRASADAYGAAMHTFGVERVLSTRSAVTREMLTGLDRFPEDLPLRRIMNHIEDSFTNPQAAATWRENLLKLPPAEAIENITGTVYAFEARAIREGGELLAGKVVEGISTRRVAGVKSFMEKLFIGEHNAAQIGKVVDNTLLRLENFSIRKLEPMLSRPWAVAQLATCGYLPMNAVEDVGMAGIFMGVSPFGVNDELIRLEVAGLDVKAMPDMHLLNLKGNVSNVLNLNLGLHRELPQVSLLSGKASIPERATEAFSRMGVRQSGTLGWIFRRNAWHNTFMKQYGTALKEVGIRGEQLTALKTVMNVEFPRELRHVQEALSHYTLSALTTGDPAAVRAVSTIISRHPMLVQSQMSAIAKHPEIYTDARHIFMRQIQEAGGVNEKNIGAVMEAVRAELIPQLQFTPQGIKMSFDDYLLSLGTNPIDTPEKALAELRMVQGAEDALNSLPHDMRSFAAEKARGAPPQNAEKIWREAFEVTTKDIGEVREKYIEMLTRTKPLIAEQLTKMVSPTDQPTIARALDRIFDNRARTARNLQETWVSYRTAVEDLILKTPQEERDFTFWQNLHAVGSDIWTAHGIERSVLGASSRSEWIQLLDRLPENASPRARTFLRRSLESAGQESEQQLDTLRARLAEYRSLMAGASERTKTVYTHQIEIIQECIVQTDVQLKTFRSRLDAIPVPQLNTVAQNYEEYNKAVLRTQELLSVDQRVAPEFAAATQKKLDEAIAEREQFITGILSPDDQRAYFALTDVTQKQAFVDNVMSGAARQKMVFRDNEVIEVAARKVLRATNDQVSPQLPRALSGAKPRYNLGAKSYSPFFESDVDKALYVVAQPHKSLADAQYLDWLKNVMPDKSEAELRDMGKQVRARIKQIVTGAPAGSVPIPPSDFIAEVGSRIPQSIDDMMLALAGDANVAKLVKKNPQAAEAIYARVVEKAAKPDLEPTELAWLAQAAMQPDMTMNPTIVRLGEKGYINVGELKNGSWHITLTPKGNEMLGVATPESIIGKTVNIVPDDYIVPPEIAKDVHARTLRDGGASVNIKGEDGTALAKAGKGGRYFVGAYPERAKVNIPFEQFNEDTVSQFIKDNQDILQKSNHYVGTEVVTDPVTGKRIVNLDLSYAAGTERDAMFLGVAKKQARIWDAVDARSIDVTRPSVIPDTINIDEILADLPPAQKVFDSTVDEYMSQVRDLADELVEKAKNPPLNEQQEQLVKEYTNKIAQWLENDKDYQGMAKKARQVAGERTNLEYNKAFINYDDVSTFDYVMQRVMPFWMYESRRWPRLARLAARRPILGAYFARAATDSDFGHVPGPFGMEFNPMKGHLATTTRGMLRSNYPGTYGGVMGMAEQGVDWMSRGGFYFMPPVSALFDIGRGEPASAIPPPIQLALHSLIASGAPIPDQLRDFAFTDRYLNYMADLWIADKLQKKPDEVRRLAAAGDNAAIAELHAAQRGAVLHAIATVQSTVLRYRPQSRTDWQTDLGTAYEEILGVPKDLQKELRTLGVGIEEIVPISGAQERALRAAVPNYDLQRNATASLQPAKVRKYNTAASAFWQDLDTVRTENRQERQLVSDRWQQGYISGPEALDQIKNAKMKRAYAFDLLHERPEYKDIPVTLKERQDYAAEHGRPPRMVSPVDEALEAYYAISPEEYTDTTTGATDWNGYFAARDAILQEFPDALRPTIETELHRDETFFEQQLRVAAPYIRQWNSVRATRLQELTGGDPVKLGVYQAYQQALNASVMTQSRIDQHRYLQQARSLAAHNGFLTRLEAYVRRDHALLRRRDPMLEQVYKQFIATPRL